MDEKFHPKHGAYVFSETKNQSCEPNDPYRMNEFVRIQIPKLLPDFLNQKSSYAE